MDQRQRNRQTDRRARRVLRLIRTASQYTVCAKCYANDTGFC